MQSFEAKLVTSVYFVPLMNFIQNNFNLGNLVLIFAIGLPNFLLHDNDNNNKNSNSKNNNNNNNNDDTCVNSNSSITPLQTFMLLAIIKRRMS